MSLILGSDKHQLNIFYTDSKKTMFDPAP